MGWYTNWFIAAESDAEAIASTVTTEERSYDDWENLGLKNIGGMELGELWRILLGRPKFDPKLVPAGKLLNNPSGEEGPFVFRVPKDFIECLAAMKKAHFTKIVDEWSQCESLVGWTKIELKQVLQKLHQFAQKACQQDQAVLELACI